MDVSGKAIVFGVIFIASFLLLGINLKRIIDFHLLAKPENRFDNIGKRIKQTLTIALAQTKIMREPIAGLIHVGIFWGFLVLLLSAIEAVIQGFYHHFSWAFLGPLYSIISFSNDFFCIIVIIAVIIALYRRFVIKVKRLQGDKKEKLDAIIVLVTIFIIVTSLLLENAAKEANGFVYNWSVKPFAHSISGIFHHSSAPTFYEIFWWIHIVAILAFMNYLPFSKHFHVYTSILNVFFANIGPVNKLKTINFEDETIEKYGVVDFEDLTWKQILDSYSCTHCGRCDSVCPANITGKVLSPRNVIVQIRNRTNDKGPFLLAEKKNKQMTNNSEEIKSKKFIGDYENIEALWQCTTCGACMQECPIMIEHVPAIIDMRRSLVMMEANFPILLQSAFSNLENNSTPWAFPQSSRADWIEGTNIKTAAENPDFDLLFWVGCAGSYDDRAKKVSLALAKLLEKANINFAILGTEENCTGDTARRTGNEYLADMLTKTNIETLNHYNVKEIVTFCPHCYNTLKNEYPSYGGNYKVYHHSQYLAMLINNGKLRIRKNSTDKISISYHDSCYLGRYNNEYQAPRDTIKNIPELQIIEPRRNRDKGLCCGAGGGQMFMEETQGKRVNIERTEELIATNPNQIAVNCPFCMTMISDGVKALDSEHIKVKDIAEILLEYIED